MSSSINPGEELQTFLKELYPLNNLNGQDNITQNHQSFVTKIDNDLNANGFFSKLVYDSSINYLLRRLITTAEYLKRKYSYYEDKKPEGFINELRRFILESTNIESRNAEKLISLLQRCLEMRSKKIRKSVRRRILKKYTDSKNELRCYICGRSLSLNNDQEEIQIEHIFPQSLGGVTEDINLKISCKYCNDKKRDHIDASDFHYEEICLVSDKNDENFKVEFAREYKIAIWAKSQYSCTICQKTASEIGRLKFGRINLNDSWHFLNVEAYCDEHTPE